jgi:hypothetical protein
MTNAASLQDSSATNQIMVALKHAQESLLSEDIRITSASASNPGIPPSSLMTFLNKVLDTALFLNLIIEVLFLIKKKKVKVSWF